MAGEISLFPYLDFSISPTFDTPEKDFALARLEPVDHRRNRPHVIINTEEQKFLIDKVGDLDLVDTVIDKHPVLQPHTDH
jgi:hypothetical protein